MLSDTSHTAGTATLTFAVALECAGRLCCVGAVGAELAGHVDGELHVSFTVLALRAPHCLEVPVGPPPRAQHCRAATAVAASGSTCSYTAQVHAAYSNQRVGHSLW